MRIMFEKFWAISLILIATGMALPLNAHHSAAAFDPNIRVNISGKVTELAWTSPHARLYVDEVQEDGTVVNWNFELPSPVGLMRRGWRKNDVAIGDSVSVSGYRAKEYPDIGIAQSVSDGEGNQLFGAK